MAGNTNLKPHVEEPLAPYTSMVAITPSDTVPLPYPTRAILVTVSGTIAVIIGGATVTIPAATATNGAILPFAVTQVKATGTSATGLFALN
jgi:hypothetical protein